MKDLPDDEKLYTLKEAIEYLGIGRTTMYMIMRTGKIQGYKVGGTWRFFRRDVKSLVTSGLVVLGVDDRENDTEQG
jgi:excisionase family DNA binding protein